MIPGGRLKLGPKRKDSGFHRLHKLHQEPIDTENLDSQKLALFDKQQNHQDFKDVGKDTHVLQLGSPRNHLHLITNTPNIGLGVKSKVNYEVFDVFQSHTDRENKELVQLKVKNQELYSIIAKLEEQKKELRDKLMTFESQTTQEKVIQTEILPEQNQARISELVIENERLKGRQKQLESELQNIDRSYYQKQISRLKAECQKLQIEGLQNKHISSLFHQQVRDHEKMMARKAEEIKNLQKQVEKGKMTLIEARNQYNQKERGIRIALEESEASNQVLCKSLEEMTKQLQREETLRKEKTIVADNLQKQIDILVTRGRESEAKCMKMRKTYQDQLAESTKKRLFIEQEQNNKNRESEALIHRLSSDIERLKFQQIEDLNASKMVDELKQESEEVEKELKIVRLQEQINQGNLSLQNKDKVISTLESTLKEYYSPNQYQALQRRCKELQEKRLSSAKYYQEKLYHYQKQNDSLRLEKINKVNKSANEVTSFDEIVKKTMQESEGLRVELKRMGEMLTQVKDQSAEVRLKQKGYLNELEILRKKVESSSKNYSIELDVQKQKLTNEIDSLRRKLSTAETRLQYKISENKQKDDFIKSVIVGRTEPLERQAVIAELERLFLQKDKKELKSHG